MSDGKQGGSHESLRQLVKPVAPAKPAGDALFVALALCVIALSAGGAMVAPSVFSWVQGLGGAQVRPIETVVAGLDRDAVKAALAREAFPDKAGRAFMTSLAENFPDDHDRLLGKLADRAMKGGDRENLMLAVNEWTAEFAPRNLSEIGRTGAKGFDTILALASDALNMLEHVGEGRCTVKTLEAVATNPTKIADLGAYGSTVYAFNMRANRTLVDLAAEGRNAPVFDATLQPEDERALQNAFFTMMSDPKVMSVLQMSMKGNGSADDTAEQVDVCSLGRTVVFKLKSLPTGTKSRLWAMGLQQAAMQGRLAYR